MKDTAETKWLLLIHQIPPMPSYFRVNIWRRLQQVGAVPIKQSVYVLPKNDQTLEDFSWMLREIKDGGGEASICEAGFIDGITDEQIITMFRESRKVDYEEIIKDTRSILSWASICSACSPAGSSSPCCAAGSGARVVGTDPPHRADAPRRAAA